MRDSYGPDELVFFRHAVRQINAAGAPYGFKMKHLRRIRQPGLFVLEGDGSLSMDATFSSEDGEFALTVRIPPKQWRPKMIDA